jgi:dihydrofolate reductase
MATIVYAMLTSLDGYIAGRSGDIDLPIPEEELHRHFNDEMRRTSIALCGRRMYETMRFWDSPERETSPDEVERDLPALGKRRRRSCFRQRLERSGLMPG